MTRSTDNPWLTRFAVLTAAATLGLIGLGGLVTSKGVGMAVPDWPTTYGQNMFLFPVSQWVGGIFYEHTHRLAASTVGLLTTVLAAWLWLKESRPWLRWLGVTAFFLVVFQGVLGGLRVTLMKDQIGIFHAGLAQTFFVLVCLIALFVSRWWQAVTPTSAKVASPRLRNLLLVAALLIYGQLILGATMRHQHAGLAVPDFPLAYGKLWPDTAPDTILRINQQRVDPRDFKPVTKAQIQLHMTHRMVAVGILAAVAVCVWRCRRELGGRHFLARLSLFWLELVILQAALGAWTVWSNKSSDITTIHVVTGAMSLAIGALLTAFAFQFAKPAQTAPDYRAATSVAEPKAHAVAVH
jgi:cytochrome c oxidase assembly protein subunit 15